MGTVVPLRREGGRKRRGGGGGDFRKRISATTFITSYDEKGEEAKERW